MTIVYVIERIRTSIKKIKNLMSFISRKFSTMQLILLMIALFSTVLFIGLEARHCGGVVGRYGEECDVECDGCNHYCRQGDGLCVGGCRRELYGEYCNYDCAGCKDGDCRQKDGTCLSGCEDGWMPPTCERKCPYKIFGVNCTKVCHCKSSCDKKNGKCLRATPRDDDCEEGYKGTSCSEAILEPTPDPEEVDRLARDTVLRNGLIALIFFSLCLFLLSVIFSCYCIKFKKFERSKDETQGHEEMKEEKDESQEETIGGDMTKDDDDDDYEDVDDLWDFCIFCGSKPKKVGIKQSSAFILRKKRIRRQREKKRKQQLEQWKQNEENQQEQSSTEKIIQEEAALIERKSEKQLKSNGQNPDVGQSSTEKIIQEEVAQIDNNEPKMMADNENNNDNNRKNNMSYNNANDDDDNVSYYDSWLGDVMTGTTMDHQEQNDRASNIVQEESNSRQECMEKKKKCYDSNIAADNSSQRFGGNSGKKLPPFSSLGLHH